MGFQSDHDKVAEAKREEAKHALIDHYIQVAINQSDEYGFLNVMGHEVPDPTVIEPPLGYVAQPDLMEQMRAMVRNTLSQIAQENEFESFEEADDFDIDDDPVDYSSPYELYFDPEEGQPPGPIEPPPEPVKSGGGGGEPPPDSPAAPASSGAPPAKPVT